MCTAVATGDVMLECPLTWAHCTSEQLCHKLEHVSIIITLWQW